MSEESRHLYGDAFVDAVTAIRFYRAFATEAEAISDLVEDSFWKTFDEVEGWASANDCRQTHEHAWRIHDAFVLSANEQERLAALGRLLRLTKKTRS